MDPPRPEAIPAVHGRVGSWKSYDIAVEEAVDWVEVMEAAPWLDFEESISLALDDTVRWIAGVGFFQDETTSTA